ncbi:antiviral reverse transcriptase Drt3a [Mucilaginibacter ginsenosidivorax]|uniref:RNA-directed DNA polymerase n=1 Tax=Mucilaginibacter ginsenosidivorax TaxID=862126 RepID=A0A5B8VZH6_9SPHI|nr:antiviral reverse transcriptase Drt3a [Mucilaginibacter ginsenosidivorax]QEC77100.1 RNA-directed DNA polymerase [Mucilaginibacter ginsenosidivorax]
MLDQSFSPDNFKTIIQILNRKGIYIEGEGKFTRDVFLPSRREANKLLSINQTIKSERERLIINAKRNSTKFDYGSYKFFKDAFSDLKTKIRKVKDEKLEEVLNELSELVNKESYKVGFNRGHIKWGKQLYVDNGTAEDFLVLKQIQYNLKKSFKVKPSSRSLILPQLITLLEDKFSKTVIRTDISSFYENIDHGLLISKIGNNNVLSSPSKRIIKQVLNAYWQTLIADGLKLSTDIRVGIPRGFGISAYLAEVFMREFDSRIRALPNVTYYARYVDDIIIIITPNSRHETISPNSYIDRVEKILDEEVKLSLNLEKTKVLDLRPVASKLTSISTLQMTFLGYIFIFKYRHVDNDISNPISLQNVVVRMSRERKKRYAKRIINAFKIYDRGRTVFLKKSNRLLIRRIKYLTSNTKLIGNKSKAFVGVYFSNIFLTEDYDDLIFLDKLLSIEINKLPASTSYLKARLTKFKFKKGFKTKIFYNYNLKTLDLILNNWD